MTPTRAVLVTQWFPPEPVLQPLWIAQALKESGIQSEILTGVPNYPTGSVVDGHRAVEVRTERLEGFTVHRTPLYPSHDAKSVGRIVNYLSWALSAALLGLRHLRSTDVVLVYSSPATAAVPAMLAKRLFDTPYVLLVQDVWPDSVFASGFLTGRARRPIEAVLRRLVSLTYRHAEHIAVISPGMVELLASRGVPREKLSVVYNWVDELPGPPEQADLRTRWGVNEDDFVLMYAGNHGAAQGLGSVIEAIGMIAEDDSCHLVLVGDGVEKSRLRALAQRVAPDRVHFVDPQPRAAMPHLMNAADAQLISLADRPLFRVTMPSKLQSAMAAGQPVLAAVSGDVSTLVEESGAGVTAVPQDSRSIADALLRLRKSTSQELREMGERGRTYYLDHMSRSVGSKRLAQILQAVARGTRS